MEHQLYAALSDRRLRLHEDAERHRLRTSLARPPSPLAVLWRRLRLPRLDAERTEAPPVERPSLRARATAR